MIKCSDCELKEVIPKRRKLLESKIKLDEKLDLLSDKYPRMREDISGLTLLIDEVLIQYKEYYLEMTNLIKK